MNRLTKLALGTVAASSGLMVAYAPAQAALLGDTVRAEFTAAGIGTFLDETDTVVDPGTEFSLPFGSNGLELDVKNDSFDIIYDLGVTSGVGADTTWILSDLDWVDTPGIITGVTLTSGDASLISGISFTDDTITIELLSYTVPPQAAVETWSFNIETSKETVPEPLTILGSLTALGFGGFFKRKLNKKRNLG